MFGWRKRNEGFEWRQYVRTTILVRREKRRQKIDDLREAAVKGVKEAGEKGVRAGAAGAERVGRAAKAGIAEAGRSLERNVWQRLRTGLAQGAEVAQRGAHAFSDKVAELAARPGAHKPVLWAAMLAAFWAAARIHGHGLDREAAVAAAMAVAALAAAGLMRLAATEPGGGDGAGEVRAALQRAVATVGAGRLMAAVAAAMALGAAWAMGWGDGLGRMTAGLVATDGGGASRRAASAPADDEPPGTVSGRATALSGDTLRVGRQTVRLDGVEAPEREQTCTLASGRTWSCGTGATQALAARVKSRSVTCDLAGADAHAARGTCRIDGTDIAADLVRGGHVFAEQGWFARYAAMEAEAREARAGLWRGEALRPADYRNRKWDEARRAAPEGCPIKGQRTSERRIYVLPWSPQYDRVKVRAARGERWFCSEAEAQAAGWQPSERS